MLVYGVMFPLFRLVRLWRYTGPLTLPQVLIYMHIAYDPSSLDPFDTGLLSAAAGSFQGPPSIECDVLYILLDYVMVCPVTTVSHIPHSVCPFFTHCFEYRALFGLCKITHVCQSCFTYY